MDCLVLMWISDIAKLMDCLKFITLIFFKTSN